MGTTKRPLIVWQVYTSCPSHGGQVKHLCKGEWCVVSRQVFTDVSAEFTGSKLGCSHNIKNGIGISRCSICRKIRAYFTSSWQWWTRITSGTSHVENTEHLEYSFSCAGLPEASWGWWSCLHVKHRKVYTFTLVVRKYSHQNSPSNR